MISVWYKYNHQDIQYEERKEMFLIQSIGKFKKKPLNCYVNCIESISMSMLKYCLFLFLRKLFMRYYGRVMLRHKLRLSVISHLFLDVFCLPLFVYLTSVFKKETVTKFAKCIPMWSSKRAAEAEGIKASCVQKHFEKHFRAFWLVKPFKC